MQQLAARLINEKVWWHRTLWWRNMAAKCSVFYTFMFEGMFVGVWSFFLSDLQHQLNFSDSELGSAVLFVYLGMVLASPFTAYLLRHLGSQRSAFIGAVLFGISLSVIPLSPTLGWLIIAKFMFGWFMGVMDISVNSAAILTETVAGVPLLGTFHGSYSVAAALGSIVGAALSSSNNPVATVFMALTIASLVLTPVFHANMYNIRQEALITAYERDSHSQHDALNVAPISKDDGDIENLDNRAVEAFSGSVSASLLDSSGSKNSLLGGSSGFDHSKPAAGATIVAFYSMVGFLAAFGESSIVTWATVYFDRSLNASVAIKSMGFNSFMVCMALGRFSCDYLRSKFGRTTIVRVGGVLACSGLILVVLAPDLPHCVAFACVGFSITGMGLSTLIPTMFSSAGHIPGGAHTGTSIAIVSMFTNAGAICSSPLVGYLTESLQSMRLALLCDAILLGIICALSWGIPEESHVFKKGSGGGSGSVSGSDAGPSKDE